MINPELLEQLQTSSVEERISLIETILQTLKQDVAQRAAVQAVAAQALALRAAIRQGSTHQATAADSHLLRGRVLHYEDPYESAADWEASP